jgi:Protein of unknown function DUF104
MKLLAAWRHMAKHIEVIYTKGVFRPAAPWALELEEGQHLPLIFPENGAELEPLGEAAALRQGCAAPAGEQVPSLEDVRRRRSTIPGSMADVVMAERAERLSMVQAFLDTRALVNSYHPADGPPEVTRRIEASGSLQYISRLRLVETVSAFAVKFRPGPLDEPEWKERRRRFSHDRGPGRLRIMPVTTARYQEATQVIARHVRSRRRTRDALQLTVAFALTQRV